MNATLEIDATDLRILNALMADAKLPFTKVAEQIPVSDGTVHVRMRKLEKMGVLKGTTLVVDYAKLGYDLSAFVGVFLEKGTDYQQVIENLNQVPEIVEAHYTTGGYSIFIKIICRNTNHLLEVLNNQIQALSGVQRTETFISLENKILRPLKLK